MAAATARPFLVGAGAALVVAIFGGAATRIGPWYRGLEKPALNPPDWLFAPAWTVIYALCVVAGVTAWREARTSGQRAWLLTLFFFNAVLNVLWSFIFFTFRRPDWALAEVATLWLSVLALIGLFSRFSPRASLILVPYLLWVTFAAYLNWGIVMLNGPFG